MKQQCGWKREPQLLRDGKQKNGRDTVLSDAEAQENAPAAGYRSFIANSLKNLLHDAVAPGKIVARQTLKLPGHSHQCAPGDGGRAE